MRRALHGVVAAAAILLAAAAPGGGQAPARPDSGHQGGEVSEAAARARAATASDPALEALTRQVSAQLRCPVCQGLSLQDSPSELAQEMRDVVKERLAAGESPEEVKRYFVSKYGEWILLQPKASGFNLLVYVLPVLALVGGIALIVVMVRRWTAGAPESDGAGDGADDATGETAAVWAPGARETSEELARSSRP